MNQMMADHLNVFSRRLEYDRVKRLLDLGLCIILLPIALPALALFSLLIVLDSPGPAMVAEERVGRGGRRFRLYRFRTMTWHLHRSAQRAFTCASASSASSRVELERVMVKPFRASRLTRVGQVLHRTGLDELPRFLNVLKGEMSLIGPWPDAAWQVNAYQEWHAGRLKVAPGITGLAQVSGRTCISSDRIVEYDLEYIEKQSLRMDLRILWLTVRSVIRGDGTH